jgi:uncharacterized protein YbgA (DUF1722 family)
VLIHPIRRYVLMHNQGLTMESLNSLTKAQLLSYIAQQDTELRSQGLALQALRAKLSVATRNDTSNFEQRREFFAAHPDARSVTPAQLALFCARRGSAINSGAH